MKDFSLVTPQGVVHFNGAHVVFVNCHEDGIDVATRDDVVARLTFGEGQSYKREAALRVFAAMQP